MENISKAKAEEIFNEFSGYIFKTAFMLTHSQFLADDIVQESFIRIFKNYHTFDESKPIKPWIYKIVLNMFREMKRKQKWLIFSAQPPENKEVHYLKVEEKLIKQEVEKELIASISRLPNKYKEVLVLYYFEDFSLKEISEILSIPIGTCKSRVHYAIKKLNKLCKDQLVLNGGEIYET